MSTLAGTLARRAGSPVSPSSRWPLLAPMAVVNLAVFLWPVFRLGQISFESRAGVLTGEYSLASYAGFLTDRFSLELLGNSLFLSLLVTFITLCCAYPIALFLHRLPPARRNLLFVITVSPLLVSAVVRHTAGWSSWAIRAWSTACCCRPG